VSPVCGPGVDRRPGISAFIRCRNEEEFIAASVISANDVFDEIVVILNRSTDGTRGIVEDLVTDRPKIRITFWNEEVSPSGPGYSDAIAARPGSSLAKYYNWCLEQTTLEYVCKWDGDMVALPPLHTVRQHLGKQDVVLFNGYDVLGKPTTDFEPRIFRYNPARARYSDWDLYEYLDHDYDRCVSIAEMCYVHMKLVKRDWWHREWRSPNDAATRPFPSRKKSLPRLTAWQRLRRLLGFRVWA
jgi:glycosyltransferase involved in cell wall biosynthesis